MIPVVVAGGILPDIFIFELGNRIWLDVRNLPEGEQIHRITQALIKHNLSLNKE